MKARALTLRVLALVAVAPAAHAQWAVIDAPAIAQLIQEVQTMQQQLATARAQLVSAEQGLRAITGDRGMGQLLGNTPRNYLPADWPQVTRLLQTSNADGYPGLSAELKAGTSDVAVLSSAQIAGLAPDQQLQIQAARQWIAMRQALAHEALANTSARFSSIQALIGAISSAGDQKATLDLQARISAELGMLQNEQTKLQVLAQATGAQEDLLRQRALEYTVAAHGRFDSRFQPSP